MKTCDFEYYQIVEVPKIGFVQENSISVPENTYIYDILRQKYQNIT